jgi:hypothetical protein
LENARKAKMKSNKDFEYESDLADDYDGWNTAHSSKFKDGANDVLIDRESKMDSPVNDVRRRNDIACKVLEGYPELSEEQKQDLISGCLPTNVGFVDKWIFIRSKIDVEIEGELEPDPHGRWHNWWSYYLYFYDNFTL